jgi:CRP/FNR family cyclic AMP-dependent transcriptional regulator
MLVEWKSREGTVPRMKKTAKTTTTWADPYVENLLENISEGKRVLNPQKGEKIFSQGDKADAIFFIQSGKVKITVVSAAGKEAVIAVVGARSFLGEGALVGQPLRISTATVLAPSCVFRVEKLSMLQALHEQVELSEKFIAALLVRNIDLEEDLCDQLFNHSEKRLARVLLKVARLREHDVAADARIPLLSHETLAEMVGTTRSRITHFMNKFRTMGLIDYNGELTVRTELLTDVVLHD